MPNKLPIAPPRRSHRRRLWVDALDADEIDGGHYISLSRPLELAGRLVAYAAEA